MTNNINKRGFGSMSKEKQATIAARGGKAAHALGRAHRYTPEEAKAAGRIGGKAHGRGRPAKVREDVVERLVSRALTLEDAFKAIRTLQLRVTELEMWAQGKSAYPTPRA